MDKILTPNDVARLLQCSPNHARQMMAWKDFPSFNLTKSTKKVQRRVFESDFLKWMERQKEIAKEA